MRAKEWTLGSKALLKKLSSEFEEKLHEATEKFLELEKRDLAQEEDVKIAFIDLNKRIAAEEIYLPSSRFTEEELIKSLRILSAQRKKEKKC